MLIYSNIQAQQNANNTQRMMMRERCNIYTALTSSFRCRLLGIMRLLRTS